ncbi:hypothetical protein IWQ47_000158 [Aquimarina sp. EL_43]|uniref:P-loop NTPase n=1 Tax=unclassified Aquimarina TaxID=2627091 RepID=UPI0018CA2562|nr:MULTISPECIES: hypothetical protein [unclassified Aquimarina]MBG6129150.1 hypothetical protein [Aquimarina sp. EL_35]MBG6150215.1 hypothetical protein [Aquimarina sp. EL_32]MBG6167100.1 hypothetical protein [Aquimarina sp. EL_43]
MKSPPDNGKSFENLCKWVARGNFGPNVFTYKKYKQNGIDIYWTNASKYHVIQCKQRTKPEASELIKALIKDFKKAREVFEEDLKEFIFATTASLKVVETKVKNESLIDVCNKLSTNKINIVVWHWEYLEERIEESPFILKHLYNTEEGAILIDDDFVIRKSEEFNNRKTKECKLEYYSGQERIQWYGIFQQWDAPRKIYNNVIDSIKSSFERRTSVATIIRGQGGSGKSVFLRRLSYDLRNDFTLYWLKDDIESFLDNEFIYDIKQNSDEKYLIILEDWYRNVEQCANILVVRKLLLALNDVNNAKLVIGDRKNRVKKIYDNYVYSDHIYDLSNTENKFLLEYIFGNIPSLYRNLSPKELEHVSKSSLFIALFVFCYDHNDAQKDLLKRYKDIIKSDIEKLKTENDPFWSGLAFVLYKYANLYYQYGSKLTIKTILQWPRYYFGNYSIPKMYEIDISILTENILIKKYFHFESFESKKYGVYHRVMFNHDTMAEYGWSVASDVFDSPFHNNTVYDIFEFLKKYKYELDFDFSTVSDQLIRIGGNISEKIATKFLAIENAHKYEGAFSSSLKILHNQEIAKQAARNFLNSENPYVNQQSFKDSLELLRTEEIAKQAARKFLNSENPHVNQQSFRSSLEFLKTEGIAKQAARNFLSSESSHMIQQSFKSSLELLKTEEVAKQAARNFLKSENPHIIQQSFFNSLELLKTEEIAKQAARNFLKSKNPYANRSLFKSCLYILKEEEIVKQATQKFLKSENPHLHKEIFCIVLQLFKKDEIIRKAVRKFLKSENPHSYKEIYCIVLQLFKEEEMVKKTVRNFLKSKNPYLNKAVFCISLQLFKEEEIVKQAARNFLKSKNPHLNKEVFCITLQLLKEEEIAKQAGRNFLKSKNPHKIQQSFKSALELLKIEKVAKQAAQNFLKSENPHLYKEVFPTTLQLFKNEEITKQVARNILNSEKLHNDYQTLSSALRLLGELEVNNDLENYALKIIRNHQNEDWRIVYHSLRILKNSTSYRKEINLTIIEVFNNKKIGFHRYREVLKIPLFEISTWLNETEYLIRNWKKQIGWKRNLLYSITISYISFPEKLKELSIGIIRNWQFELRGEQKHKAYFTRCLANINITGDQKLKNEVINICNTIQTTPFRKVLRLTPDLEKQIEQIVKLGKFPEWRIRNDNT